MPTLLLHEPHEAVGHEYKEEGGVSVCACACVCVCNAGLRTTFAVSWNCRNLVTDAYTFLPHLTALTIDENELSISNMSAASCTHTHTHTHTHTGMHARWHKSERPQKTAHMQDDGGSREPVSVCACVHAPAQLDCLSPPLTQAR